VLATPDKELLFIMEPTHILSVVISNFRVRHLVTANRRLDKLNERLKKLTFLGITAARVRVHLARV
jgi:hypothetical protein